MKIPASSFQNLQTPQIKSLSNKTEKPARKYEKKEEKASLKKRKMIKKQKIEQDQKYEKVQSSNRKQSNKTSRSLKGVDYSQNPIQILSRPEQRYKVQIKQKKKEKRRKDQRKLRRKLKSAMSDSESSCEQNLSESICQQKRQKRAGRNSRQKKQKVKKIKYNSQTQNRNNLPSNRQTTSLQIDSNQLDIQAHQNLLDDIDSNPRMIDIFEGPPVHRVPTILILPVSRQPIQLHHETMMYPSFRESLQPRQSIRQSDPFRSGFLGQLDSNYSRRSNLFSFQRYHTEQQRIIEPFYLNHRGVSSVQNNQQKNEDHAWFLSNNKTYSCAKLTNQQLEKCDNCIICFESFIDQKPVINSEGNAIHPEVHENQLLLELFCEHLYHKKCITKWLKQKPICPCCRKDFRQHDNYKEWDTNYQKRISQEPRSSIIFNQTNIWDQELPYLVNYRFQQDLFGYPGQLSNSVLLDQYQLFNLDDIQF